MNRKIADFLKEPLSGGRLKLFPSLLVFGCSIFVNAYFQMTSFSALVQWFLKTSGEANAQQRLEEILGRSDTPIGIRIAFGLLMTAFVMMFLLLAAYWEEKDKNIGHLFERACSSMIVPVLLMLIAAFLMNGSLAAGIIFGIAASIDCMTVIVSTGRKAKCNSYALIATSTAFFLITVVLLTRNHLAKMMVCL